MRCITAENKKTIIIGLGGAGQNIVTSNPDWLTFSNIILVNMDERVLLLKEDVAGCFYLGNGKAYSANDVQQAIDKAIPEIIATIGDAYNIVIVSGASGKTGSQAPYFANKLILEGKKVALALMKPMPFESTRHYIQAADDIKSIEERCFWCELFSWDLSIGGGLDHLMTTTNKKIMSRIVTVLNDTGID